MAFGSWLSALGVAGCETPYLGKEATAGPVEAQGVVQGGLLELVGLEERTKLRALCLG